MKTFKKKLNQFILKMMPGWLRHQVIRRSVTLPNQLSSDLLFKIAETKEELEAAFRLVYESYLPLGYCKENSFKMRATIYHAVPTTTTLIALDGKKVVGTLTIVRDGRLGIPLDKIFDVSHFRKKANRIAEITSLVIDRNYRREKGGQILFPLLRLMYEYSTSYFGVNQLLVTVHPDVENFYRSLLLFKEVKGTGVVDYLGAPAICLHLDLQHALFAYKKAYSKMQSSHNLFNFFVERKIVNVQLPKRAYNKINDPLVKLEYFQELFVNKLFVCKDLNERRRAESILRHDGAQRLDPRIEVEAPASFGEIKLMIKDVSRKGFRALTAYSFDIDKEITLQIEVAPTIRADVIAQIVWMSPEQGIGFQILKADKNWQEFISYLYREQYGRVA